MKLHSWCISITSAVAVGALVAGAPAAAAAGSAAKTAPDAAAGEVAAVPLPWSLDWLNGKASGSYTVVQAPLGIGRTYTVTGTVVSGSAAECYFVRFTAAGSTTDSPRACGSTPASFALKTTVATASPMTIRLCRAVAPSCGPAKSLGGGVL